MTSFNPPANAEFVMGTTEQKMDMSLDEIIKLTKKSSGKKRVPIKSRERNPNNAGARAALQRSVAARSSKMRQGKFAEARARNGAGSFAATQAAGKRAFSIPVNTRIRQRMMNSDNSRRNNFRRQPFGFVPKLNSFNGSADNMKISVSNGSTKNGMRRQTTVPPRRLNGGNRPTRQFIHAAPDTDQMHVDYPPPRKQKPRTLDALFASIHAQRMHNTPQGFQPFTSLDRGNRRAPFRRQFGQ